MLIVPPRYDADCHRKRDPGQMDPLRGRRRGAAAVLDFCKEILLLWRGANV